MGTKAVLKKIGAIVVNILLTLFFVFAVLCLILSVTLKKSEDGATNLFGKEIRFVLTGSMEKNAETDVSKYEIKSIKRRSLVVIECVPENKAEAQKWYSELKKGDVLTFRYGLVNEPITHRIVEIEENQGGGYTIVLQGDNKAAGSTAGKQTVDTSSTAGINYVIGKVTDVNYPLGLMVYAMRSPVGMVLIIIVPCLIIIGLEISKIVSVFAKEKKEKQDKAQAEKDEEIERLKEQIELLKKEKDGGADENKV